MNGEITEVRSALAPGACGPPRARQAGRTGRWGRPDGQQRHATTTMADQALTRRSRSSMRCCTNGCSVPASSSSFVGGQNLPSRWKARPGSSADLLGAEPQRGQRPTTPGYARRRGLVPVGHGALLEAPVLAGMAVHRVSSRAASCCPADCIGATPVASAQDFSKSSLAPVDGGLDILGRTSTVSFIFLSSSSSMERLTSALTSDT
jgi:hypothetical protein